MIFTKKQTLTPRQQAMQDLRDHEFAFLEHDDKAAYHKKLAEHHKERIVALQAILAEPEIEINLPERKKSWTPNW